jgi:hypothetical protein
MNLYGNENKNILKFTFNYYYFQLLNLEKNGKYRKRLENEKFNISYCLLLYYLAFGKEIRGYQIFSATTTFSNIPGLKNSDRSELFSSDASAYKSYTN